MLCAQCLRRLDTSAQWCPACKADPLLGGRYRLDRPLGERDGENSYRGTRVEDALLVRVRAVSLDHAGDSSFGHAARESAAKIAKLEHRGLPRLIETCEIDGEHARLCLIHEYVRGRTLLEFVHAEPERSRDPAWLLHLLSELAAALAYLHGQSPAIAHGQISVNTILVGAGPDLRACLLDMQLAGSASPAADLRALGVLLASLLAGEVERVSSEPPPRWREHVDSQIAHLIERMLANDPEHQITSVALREAATTLARARGADERRSPPTLARPLRPTPRFVMLETVSNPDGSLSQTARPVPAAYSRAAARRPSDDIPVLRPDELSRELSQAHHASEQFEEQKQKQNVFARVAVALVVAMLAALATYLAMNG
jgi:serine/threonine protein kinase